MAIQLWLLRHGEAEPHDARRDHHRRLTARGERQARAAGGALVRLGLELDTVFTSPRVRALGTARLACLALGLEPVVHEPLAGGFDAREAVALTEGARGPTLLVGHEPDLSQVVADLTGGRVDFKKGGVAGLRLDGSSGKLLALLRPRELESLAGFGRPDGSPPRGATAGAAAGDGGRGAET
jgi:phosphohistidine phosphatase